MRRKPVRRNYGKMRSEVSQVAGERIGLLLEQARDILPENKDRAKRCVELAKKISMRTKVRIPRESKQYLCKSCGLPLVLGTNARVRLRSGNQRIIISCLGCGAVRRYPYRKP